MIIIDRCLGAMVQEGYGYLITYPILNLVPGVATGVVVYALNMIGDGLRGCS